MNKTSFLYVAVFSIFSWSCTDINDSSKRNSDWVWVQDLNGKNGSWHKYGGKQMNNGIYTLFYDTGARREIGKIEEGQYIDTMFFFNEKDDSLGFEIQKGKKYYSISTGVYNVYHHNGNIKLKANFTSNGNGIVTEYSKDNSKIAKIPLFKGLKNGQLERFYSNGKIQSIREYLMDTLHGKSRLYFKHGGLALEVNFKNGKREGKQISYHDTGEIYRIDYLKEDKRNGLHEEFYKNGQVRMRTQCVNDEYDGTSEYFFKNGKLYSTGFFKNGLFEGTCKVYGSEKGLFQELEYKNDEIESRKDYRELTPSENSEMDYMLNYPSEIALRNKQLWDN